MHGIDLKRVALGGTAAGLVLDAGEYLLHAVVLEPAWRAARQARELGGYGPGEVAISAGMMLLLGFVLVWVYAAMRPRFGPGGRTALRAGFLIWVLAWLWPFLANLVWHFLPTELLLLAIAWGFFEIMVAALVGARIYREA